MRLKDRDGGYADRLHESFCARWLARLFAVCDPGRVDACRELVQKAARLERTIPSALLADRFDDWPELLAVAADSVTLVDDLVAANRAHCERMAAEYHAMPRPLAVALSDD